VAVKLPVLASKMCLLCHHTMHMHASRGKLAPALIAAGTCLNHNTHHTALTTAAVFQQHMHANLA
jgi:hypothetical protein